MRSAAFEAPAFGNLAFILVNRSCRHPTGPDLRE
jgi:hypothetical protein